MERRTEAPTPPTKPPADLNQGILGARTTLDKLTERVTDAAKVVVEVIAETTIGFLQHQARYRWLVECEPIQSEPEARIAPATIRTTPTPVRMLRASPRKATARTIVTTRLALSIAVTGVAAPSDRALK